MTLTRSPRRKTAFIQSRFTSGTQSVYLDTANTRSEGPKYGDITTRGPPNQARISLDHSAPSLSSPRFGVRHTQPPRMQSPIAAVTMAPFQP